MPRGMTSGVAVSVLLGLCGVPASPAASSQVAVDGQTLLRVELPDLSRMHGAVQEQLREAYTSLRVLESASEL